MEVSDFKSEKVERGDYKELRHPSLSHRVVTVSNSGDYMPCYSPLQGVRSFDGKVKIGGAWLGAAVESKVPGAFPVPCGRCIGCRLEHSRQWAMRLMHEAEDHVNNCFITLTYSPEQLPVDGSLDLRTFQLFMKRLRKSTKDKIRFFHCGEYGETLSRPHYHAILFGHDFSDKKKWKRTGKGCWIYRSDALEELWPYGFSSVANVSFESCAYVARYCLKKRVGPNTDEWYCGRKPEYTTMSRGYGIGRKWFDRWRAEVYKHDHVIVRGNACRPPRYYDGLLARVDPEEYLAVKLARIEKGQGVDPDDSLDRLKVRAEVCRARQKQFKRVLHGDENKKEPLSSAWARYFDHCEV